VAIAAPLTPKRRVNMQIGNSSAFNMLPAPAYQNHRLKTSQGYIQSGI
jgi:hypothetical protein